MIDRIAARLSQGRAADQTGAAALEFGLIALPFLALVLGAIQYGWYFFSAQSASSAARETTRRIIVGECATQTSAQTFAANQANVIGLSLNFGTPTSPTTNTVPAVGDTLRVTVTADGDIIGFWPLPNGGQVVRYVDARVENVVKSPATC